MDDRTAIDSCVRGNREGFRHLVEEYQGQALAHALVLLGQREDARDALQEAFLKAYRALPRFDPSRRFYPWFYVILRNCCFRLAERNKRQPGTREFVDLLVKAPAGREEAAAEVSAALRGLRRTDREIIVLRHFDGLSYEELTARLTIPKGSVMSRLYHARKRLRVALEARRSEEKP